MLVVLAPHSPGRAPPHSNKPNQKENTPTEINTLKLTEKKSATQQCQNNMRTTETKRQHNNDIKTTTQNVGTNLT